MENSRVTGFWHAGVTVSDMEEALRFYRDGLGLELESRRELEGGYAGSIVGLEIDSIDAVFLRVPGSDAQVELFEYRGVERHSASCRPCDHGAGHFCLYVEDLEALAARLRAAGFSARTEPVAIDRGPRAGATVVYAIDPDGYHVELYEPPGSAAGPQD
jgi:lactoylglutathione lyase